MSLRTDRFAVPPADADSSSIAAQGVVRHVRQKRPLWCWAACVEMVLRARGQTITQCEIARNPAAPAQNCCALQAFLCGTLPPAGAFNTNCDRLVTEEENTDIWHRHGINAVQQTGSLPQPDLTAEVGTKKRPVQAWLEREGMAHLVLITGVTETDDFLIADPCSGETEIITYDTLLHHPRGDWLFSWTNLEVK